MAPEKMTSTGISLGESEMEKIRILMRGDRRSLSWLVREAVQMYLQTRAEDIAKYIAQFAVHQPGHQATSAKSAAVGHTDNTEKN